MNLLYVVRRYGPVGGMERYVWEVTRELTALGHHVEVVCERCHADKPQGIAVHELGEIAPRPRWLSLLRFGGRVKNWLKRNPRPGFVIHSNERLAMHDVTTFHAQPFASVRDKPIWKRLSLRVAMQLYLEWRELSVARVIVPNSSITRRQLAHYYPQFSHKLTFPIAPGVAAVPTRRWHAAPLNGGVVAFVGKEWKRKGLPFALRIVAELRRIRPELELWVIGPEEREVWHLFGGWDDGNVFLGWRNDSEYLSKIDVLLHPARAEPYGMVISEAMAAQIPVVVSDACGAADDVAAASGSVVPLQATLKEWVDAVQAQLQRPAAPPVFVRGWADLAAEYERIYRQGSEDGPEKSKALAGGSRGLMDQRVGGDADGAAGVGGN